MCHKKEAKGIGLKASAFSMAAQVGASMTNEFPKKSRGLVVRILYFRAPSWLIYSYVIALSLIYIIVVVHTPIAIWYPGSPHDDSLFISLGRSLAEGKWLGTYSQFTLMKGPGYPAFLAIANWLGISASLAHALFYCGAVVFFVAVAHRFIKSYLISGVLLVLLLWNFLPTTPYIGRILRQQIYAGQVLFIFAAAAGALFYAREKKQRIMFAALTGFFLGWFCLTREESVWILPAGLLLFVGAVVHAFHYRLLGELAGTLLMAIAIFASIQVGFRAINWAFYGTFISVDVKEANFQRALRAINSARSGGTKPFVSITHATMKRVDAVSPAFASLAPYFDGPGKDWETFGCAVYPNTCGEIASGWFMWALRDAAARSGHYSSPAVASAFFGRVADEITAACARATLECSPQLIAEMPPVNWPEVIKRIPPLYAQSFESLLFLHPPLQFLPSAGSDADLAAALRFLNYPLHTKSSQIATDTYSLSGWYLKSGRKWLSAKVMAPSGLQADVRVERKASPDIQAGFKDPEASHQRFVLQTHCGDECTLELKSDDGEIVQKKLAEFRHDSIGFDLGQGHVHVDSATVQADPTYTVQWMDAVSGSIRQVILNNYAYFVIPVIILGGTSFLAALLLYRRHILINVSYIMALCSWTLVVVRTSLIVVVAATSMPVLYDQYLWPAHIFLVTGALFSCAALARASLAA